MHPAPTLVLALFMSLIPAQVRQTVAVQSGMDPCTGLSAAECCAQKLKVAGFNKNVEELPERAQLTVTLSCDSEDKTMPAAACRSIAMSRGFSSQESNKVCVASKIRKACAKDRDCRKCSAELKKLSYKNTQHACFAVTYQPEQRRKGVVVLRLGSDKPANGIEVLKRRTRIQ